MASLNQLISEIAHAVGQPNNVPLRRNIKYAVIHTRNELIRKSYENHKYLDKGLQQRIRVSIIDTPDGDINFQGLDIKTKSIKRTKLKVPKPVRLINNLPFQSIRTVGHRNISIPFVREGMAQFYDNLVGMCNNVTYDYINEYIYFFGDKEWFKDLGSIVIESVFEYPHLISIETHENKKQINYNIDENEVDDDNEFLLPEDMIADIKTIIFKRNLLDITRETNEIPVNNLINR